MSDAEARREESEARMRLLQSAVVLFSVLFILLVLALGADKVLRSDNFPVRHVRFEGEFKHVSQKELESAVMKAVQGNFFLLNLDKVKSRVESVPWVYKASIRRQWPQDVSVRFSEQQLAAYWGEKAFINHSGDVVHVPGDGLIDALPRLKGPEGTGRYVLDQYHVFGKILAQVGLKLDQAMLTPRRTWQLKLSQGMLIVLDREQPESKLKRFTRVYAHSLIHEASDIKHVDLRYTNGFAVERAGSRTADVKPVMPDEDVTGNKRMDVINKG